MYGIPRPEWAADAAAVAAAAGKVVVPEFVPKKGVKIETDPKVGRRLLLLLLLSVLGMHSSTGCCPCLCAACCCCIYATLACASNLKG